MKEIFSALEKWSMFLEGLVKAGDWIALSLPVFVLLFVAVVCKGRKSSSNIRDIIELAKLASKQDTGIHVESTNNRGSSFHGSSFKIESSLLHELSMLVCAGKKVEAIKLLREKTGADLAAAKRAIDVIPKDTDMP